MDFKNIHTFNKWHLGDCIYSIIMLKNIYKYIESNNITVYFYCNDEYLEQVKDFNNSENVIVKSLKDDNLQNENIYFINLWIGDELHPYNYWNYLSKNNMGYDRFFCDFYNYILTDLNIPVKIEKFIYYDFDLFKRCEYINEHSNNYYTNIDFLINNGQPLSSQFKYNLNEWNAFISKLSEKYNVVTTQKVNDIKCTRDYNLKIKDIASISLNANNIIAIESGVISGFYNVFIADNPNKTVYTLSDDNKLACSFNNFIHKNKLSDLYFLIQ